MSNDAEVIWLRNLTFAVAVALFCSFQSLAQGSLPPDTAAVYRAFLTEYNNDSDTTLNIADKTIAFGPDPGSEDPCLKEIHMSAPPVKVTHSLDASILPDRMKARLISPAEARRSRRDPGDAIRQGKSVDDAVREGFAAGLLTLSEVIFSADHSRAVVSYEFICGRLCGNGGAILFEKRDSKWGHAKQVCGSWVS